jgi:hypothetical protein
MAVRKRLRGLEVAHPNAAGIDIGSASHYVAVPPDRDDEPVRQFRSFTVDLEALAQWLKECGVEGIDGGVLDSTVRIARVAGVHSAPGECAPRQERLGTQVGMSWIASGCSNS